MNRKFSDKITLLEMYRIESVRSLFKTLNNGAELRVLNTESGPIDMVVEIKDHYFYVKKCKETLPKWFFMKFIRSRCRTKVIINRNDIKPEFAHLSDTQIARQLGDQSLLLTMMEMSEEGKDVWGC